MAPDSTLTEFLRNLLDTRSLTVIEYEIEERLADQSLPSVERELLETMLKENALDAIYAECHLALGNLEQAKIHQDWEAVRASRQARTGS